MAVALSNPRPRPSVRLAWTLALVLVLAACSSPSASPTGGDGAGGGDGSISLSGSAFSPSSVTVAFGDPIVFVNDDGVEHRIVQGEDGTEVADPAVEAIELAPGESSQEIRFSPGTYNLTCTIHSSMNMTVTVTE